MAFKKSCALEKRGIWETLGGTDTSWTGDVDGFYVAFLYRNRFGVCFLLHTSAHECSNDLFVLFFFFCRCWYHFGWHHAFISRMSTLNQRISGSPHSSSPCFGFFFSSSSIPSQLHMFPKSEANTHKDIFWRM